MTGFVKSTHGTLKINQPRYTFNKVPHTNSSMSDASSALLRTHYPRSRNRSPGPKSIALKTCPTLPFVRLPPLGHKENTAHLTLLKVQARLLRVSPRGCLEFSHYPIRMNDSGRTEKKGSTMGGVSLVRANRKYSCAAIGL